MTMTRLLKSLPFLVVVKVLSILARAINGPVPAGYQNKLQDWLLARPAQLHPAAQQPLG